jgi:cell division protein FtsB
VANRGRVPADAPKDAESAETPKRGRRVVVPTKRMTPVPAPGRRGRTAVVSLLVLGLLLAYAYPVRVYLNQQAEIAALEAAQERQRQHIAELAILRKKWDDDEYVAAQARSRLGFVFPGDRVYIVVQDPEGAAIDAGKDLSPAPSGPWYTQIWDSLAGPPATP